MRRRLAWIGGIIAGLVVLVILASFLVDEPLRRLVERQMNERLKGYTVRIQKLDFHPIGLSVDFEELSLTQNAHPDPPVARFGTIEASVQWRALLRGAVVANFTVRRPVFHVNLAHLREEARDETPVKKRGWQDAVKAMYPLDLNELRVEDGQLTYVDDAKFKPLELTRVQAVVSNVRNAESRDRVYPSNFKAEAVVFDTGHLELDGSADFLAEPYMGVLSKFKLEQIELAPFKPILERYHADVRRGVLSASGDFEYGPKVAAVHIEDALLSGPDLEYAYVAQPTVEKQVAKVAAEKAAEAANRPDVQYRVDRFRVGDGTFAFLNRSAPRPYRVFISKTELTLTNLSNHFADGAATARLTGLFMGTGETTVVANFRAETNGPDFDINARIVNTQMKAMNDMLRAHGKFDVADGAFSFFAQIAVKNREVTGYVKPLFRNVDVYDPAQDADKGFARKLWERVVGAVSKILQNRPRDEVATRADIGGRLDNPQTSTWQVVVNLVQNAFFQAILPGFEREVTARRA